MACGRCNADNAPASVLSDHVGSTMLNGVENSDNLGEAIIFPNESGSLNITLKCDTYIDVHCIFYIFEGMVQERLVSNDACCRNAGSISRGSEYRGEG